MDKSFAKQFSTVPQRSPGSPGFMADFTKQPRPVNDKEWREVSVPALWRAINIACSSFVAGYIRGIFAVFRAYSYLDTLAVRLNN